MTDLNGASLYAWVVSSYLLSSTVTVPIYGKFSDVFGRKVMLIIGVCLFLIGSWLSGASQNMNELVAFRLERAGSRSSARATARRLYSGCPSVPPTSRCWT